MDPVSALGAASGVVGIASFGIQISQILYQYISDARDHKVDLKAIINGVRSTTNALEMIRDLLETEQTHISQHGEPILFTEQALVFVRDQGNQCLLLFWRIENEITKKHSSETLEEYLANRLSDYHDPKIENQERKLQLDPDLTLSTMRRLAWPLVLPKLKDYRTQLEQHQINLSLMLQVMQLASLQKEMAKRQERARLRETRRQMIAQIQRTADQAQLPLLAQEHSSALPLLPSSPKSYRRHVIQRSLAHEDGKKQNEQDGLKSGEDIHNKSPTSTAHRFPSGMSPMIFTTHIPDINNSQIFGSSSVPKGKTETRDIIGSTSATPNGIFSQAQLPSDDSSTENDSSFMQRQLDLSGESSNYEAQSIQTTEASSVDNESGDSTTMISPQSASSRTTANCISGGIASGSVARETSRDSSRFPTQTRALGTTTLATTSGNSSNGVDTALEGTKPSNAFQTATAGFSRKQLTTYSAYTINTEKKRPKGKDEFIKEHVSQDQIISRIEELNKEGPSALKKKLKLLREQQEQIDSLLTAMLKQERDDRFTWLLAQFEMQLSRLPFSQRPRSITAYLTRELAGKDGIDSHGMPLHSPMLQNRHRPIMQPTYVSSGETIFVGKPALGRGYSEAFSATSLEDQSGSSYPLPRNNKHNNSDLREGPGFGISGLSSQGSFSLSPGSSRGLTATTSSSHQHISSSTNSSNDHGAQWTLDRVLTWLAMNQFSNDWQATFKGLNLHGSQFLELGNGNGARGNFGIMHQQVYPRLAKECSFSGTGWDQAREREEGKRLRKLIRGILKEWAPLPKTMDSEVHKASASHGSFKSVNLDAKGPPKLQPSSDIENMDIVATLPDMNAKKVHFQKLGLSSKRKSAPPPPPPHLSDIPRPASISSSSLQATQEPISPARPPSYSPFPSSYKPGAHGITPGLGRAPPTIIHSGIGSPRAMSEQAVKGKSSIATINFGNMGFGSSSSHSDIGTVRDWSKKETPVIIREVIQEEDDLSDTPSHPKIGCDDQDDEDDGLFHVPISWRKSHNRDSTNDKSFLMINASDPEDMEEDSAKELDTPKSKKGYSITFYEPRPASSSKTSGPLKDSELEEEEEDDDDDSQHGGGSGRRPMRWHRTGNLDGLIPTTMLCSPPPKSTQMAGGDEEEIYLSHETQQHLKTEFENLRGSRPTLSREKLSIFLSQEEHEPIELPEQEEFKFEEFLRKWYKSRTITKGPALRACFEEGDETEEESVTDVSEEDEPKEYPRPIHIKGQTDRLGYTRSGRYECILEQYIHPQNHMVQEPSTSAPSSTAFTNLTSPSVCKENDSADLDYGGLVPISIVDDVELDTDDDDSGFGLFEDTNISMDESKTSNKDSDSLAGDSPLEPPEKPELEIVLPEIRGQSKSSLTNAIPDIVQMLLKEWTPSGVLEYEESESGKEREV